MIKMNSINNLKEPTKKKLVLLSLLMLVTLFSVHSLKYALVYLWVIVYGYLCIRKKERITLDLRILLISLIWMMPGAVHFVRLWSGLIIIGKIAGLLHLSSIYLMIMIVTVLIVLSLPAAMVITGEVISRSLKLIRSRRNATGDVSGGVFLLLICALFTLASIVTISLKSNYHLDELMSYGLSNHVDGIYMTFDEGKRYIPADRPFLDYLVLDRDHRFDYLIPYTNQVIDVHPPFYYYILHTICSLFPETFNKWYAGAVNIFFGVLTVCVLYKIFLLHSKGDRRIAYFGMPLFVLSAGILNAVAFLRMYIMAMFFCLLMTFMLLKAKDRENDHHFYTRLFIVILLGALTHYYVIIYDVFICIVFGIMSVVEKKWKDVAGLILASAMAALSAIALFPRMLYHMFVGYRGEEALANLTSTKLNYFARIRSLYKIINKDILGGFGVMIIIVIIASVIFMFIRKKNRENTPMNTAVKEYLLMAIPLSLYCFLIPKLVWNLERRYFYPVYAVICALVYLCVYDSLVFLFGKRMRVILGIVLSVAVCAGGIVGGKWNYLYKNTESLLAFSKENTDKDCLYVYDDVWMIPPSYLEVKNYNSVTFVRGRHLALLQDLDICSESELIVVMAGVPYEDIKEAVFSAFPLLNSCEEIGTHSDITTYCFYK